MKISIDEAEDDICFNAKEQFEDSRVISLIGLRYTEDDNTNEWEKRKLEYTPAFSVPIEFQELLDGDFANKCSFLYALHPENINKEILSVIGSAHIFVDKNNSSLNSIQCSKNGFLILKLFRRFRKTSKNHQCQHLQLNRALSTNWLKCSNTDKSCVI